MFKGGIAAMMQKAQKMQQNVQTIQEEIKTLTVTGNSGNEVQIAMNGEYQVSDITISDAALKNKEMLSDMLRVAINDATTQIQTLSSKKMKEATDGINLPF